MSAYLKLPVRINTMVCRTCGTESFAWLAEIFVCTNCGDHDYVFPMFATSFNLEGTAPRRKVSGVEDEFGKGHAMLEPTGEKRKRMDSAEGD